MKNIKIVMAWLSTTVGMLAAAAFIIQLQCGRIDGLKGELEERDGRIYADSLLKAALEDSLKNVGHYSPLPDRIPVTVPSPPEAISRPPKPDVDDAGGYSNFDAYAIFPLKQDWDAWYRKYCTGVIADTLDRWIDKKRGVGIEFAFYYGIGTDSLNFMLVYPIGDWRPPVKGKEGFRGGLEWQLSNKGDLSLGADITWRKWGPTARIDFLHNDKPTYWGGVRRNFW